MNKFTLVPIILLSFVLLTFLQGCTGPAKPKAVYNYTLKVSLAELVSGYADGNRDSFFNATLKRADSLAASGSQSFIRVLKDAYSDKSKEGKFTAIFAPLRRFSGDISANTPNFITIAMIDSFIRRDMNEDAANLKRRIDQFGMILKGDIRTDCEHGTMELECQALEKVDVYELRKILTTTGRCEFWNTYENEELINNLAEANKALGASFMKNSHDSLKLDPIFRIMAPNYDQNNGVYPGPAIGRSFGKDTAKINQYFATDIVRTSFPRDVKFLWGAKPASAKADVYELYAIKINSPFSDPPLDGEFITDAQYGFSASGSPDITLTMTPQGASKWEHQTEENANSTMTVQGRSSEVKRCIAIVIDNRVISAPRVQNKITGGNTEITGLGDVKDAMAMANILKAGALHSTISILEESMETNEAKK